MSKKIIFLFSILGIIYLSLSLYRIWQINLPLISPVDLVESLPQLAPIFKKPGAKVVFGFLPYWNMKDSDKLFVRSLTHLAYFGIDLNEDGSIKKYDKPGEKEPGWNKLNSTAFTILSRQIKLLGKKLILVVRVMDNDQIDNLLKSPDSRQKAIGSILNLVADKQFDGVNVDFEYMGYPSKETRDYFTQFVSELSTKCKTMNQKCEMSLDVFADSAIKNRLYDLKALAKTIDLIIVMAYDFHRPSSIQSGPVAPLRGKCTNSNTCLDYDVVTSISDITKLVPAYKLLLGVPFYGYEWQTVDREFLARTYPKTGGLATYKRVRDLLSDATASSLSATWSAATFTPYLSYFEDGNIYQIHYDDENSLRLKIEFVHQAKLTGVAIWALGYELPYDNLWQTIAKDL
jgi:spore germination protein YaaH